MSRRMERKSPGPMVSPAWTGTVVTRVGVFQELMAAAGPNGLKAQSFKSANKVPSLQPWKAGHREIC